MTSCRKQRECGSLLSPLSRLSLCLSLSFILSLASSDSYRLLGLVSFILISGHP